MYFSSATLHDALVACLMLLQRYNPDLQKRSLENRKERQEDFDKFVTNLKEYSKSDKPSKYIYSIPMHFRQNSSPANLIILKYGQ